MKLDLPDWGWQFFFVGIHPIGLLTIFFFFLRGVFFFFLPACRNILSGASKISIYVSTEIFFGRPTINSAAKMRSTPLFVWHPDAEMTGGLGEFSILHPIMPSNHATFITLKWEIWNCRSRWSPLVQGKKLFLLPNTYTAAWWWLEHDFYFPIWLGNVIIPVDETIFFRGVGSTTNQKINEHIFLYGSSGPSKRKCLQKGVIQGGLDVPSQGLDP